MISLQEKSQIIGLHIKGKSNRKIAKELGLSRDTVNKYVAEYDKLQAELLAAGPDDGEAVRDATERIVAEPKYDSSGRRARKWTQAMDLRLDEILAAEARKRKVLGWDRARRGLRGPLRQHSRRRSLRGAPGGPAHLQLRGGGGGGRRRGLGRGPRGKDGRLRNPHGREGAGGQRDGLRPPRRHRG